MAEKEFNLLDEPWIRVMDGNCRVREVSLTDALLNAHQYTALSGELPTQDIVVLRLLLAVLHTVFSRVDVNGGESEIEDEEEAVQRWKSIWDLGRLPQEPIQAYLNEWHERFWLFHPERPFGHGAELTYGTRNDAPKLNGQIAKSGNKQRLFSSYSGKSKAEMSYAQAARWLLHLNAYDDTSSKPSKEGKAKSGGKLPSPGIGWLGKLGIVFLKGNNLFETLLLNFVLVNGDRIENKANPLWEKENVSAAERTEIAMPDNLAELYTLQSRRISLQREGDWVTGYILLGGDFFQKENAFSEPMTVWRTPKKEGEFYTPKRHNPEKQMWREFSALYSDSDNNHTAGAILWFKNYVAPVLKKSVQINTSIVSVLYGDKDFFVKNVFADSLTMHKQLLEELGKNWRTDIQSEIVKCEKLAGAAGALAQKLYIASGGSNNDCEKAGSSAKADLYFRLDIPFRNWLASVEPDDFDGKTDKLMEWQKTAKRIAFDFAEELSANTGESAMTGHLIKNIKTGSSVMYAAPKALNQFRSEVAGIYKII